MTEFFKSALTDKDYMNIVSDIINNQEFQKLRQCVHHRGLSRFEHCIHVSYSCFKNKESFGYKYRKDMIRGALLHDFFLYDYRKEKSLKKHLLHGFFHPGVSLKMSEEHFKLSVIEKDVIRKHMFPLTFFMPKYKATWYVVFYDKLWAVKELLWSVCHKYSDSEEAKGFIEHAST